MSPFVLPRAGRLPLPALALALLAAPAFAQGYLGTIEARKAALVEDHAYDPWPDPNSTDVGAARTGQIALAYASYLVGETAMGDQWLQALYDAGWPAFDGPDPEDFPASLVTTVMMRMYVQGTVEGGFLGLVQREQMHEMAWRYLERATDYDLATGDVWASLSGHPSVDSENHAMVRSSSCLLAAYVLSNTPAYASQPLPDGRLPAEHYQAWLGYEKGWLRERARAGLFEEMSQQYGKYTAAGIYNLADFPGDAELRALAARFLHLLWHDAAHDFNARTGIQGASGARLYQPDGALVGGSYYQNPTANWTYPWLYLYAWHDTYVGPATHPVILTAANSAYVPLDLTRALALMTGKDYAYASRRPARTNAVVGSAHDIRRDVSANDDFILAAQTYGIATEHKKNVGENDWYGVIVNDAPSDRLIVSGQADPKPGNASVYADYWVINGTAHRDVIIAARDRKADNAPGMRVYFGAGALRDHLVEDASGWAFTRAGNAYLAIRIAGDDYDRPLLNGQVAAFQLNGGEDVWSPLVVQAARAGAFADFEAFQAAVRALPYAYEAGEVTFTSLLGDTFQMSRQQSVASLPRVNGVPVDTAPPFTYSSPYLAMDWGAYEAILTGPDGTPVTLDFAPGAASSSFAASLVPEGAPVVLPPSGGPVRYRAALVNLAAAPQAAEAWTTLTLPDGGAFGLLDGPRAVTLEPGQTAGPLRLRKTVPASAPPGVYTVTLHVGTYPDSVVASDAFSFEKAAPVLAARTAGAATAYPNPFAEAATIRFALPAPAAVRLVVYDVLGREVAVLLDGPVAAGAHAVTLDGQAFAAGAYVWQLEVEDPSRGAGARVETGRLTLLR
jgi:hypothetical protein